MPLADLYGTVTFYHHFARDVGGLHRPRVCTGPVCRQRGALDIVKGLAEAEEMPCSGRCDDPVPMLIGHETFVATPPFQRPQRRISSPMPVPNPGQGEECVFASIREPERNSLKGYERSGGYEALRRALLEAKPTGVIDLLKESKLAGRGGAGFPTGLKWQFVREATGDPKSVVCNADEGEPGCFKDRALMDHDPFALIEGLTLAGYATGGGTGLHLPAIRVPGDLCAAGRSDPGRGRRRSPGEGHFGQRGHLPSVSAARGGRLHLRRRGLFAEQPGRQAPLPAQPAAISHDTRL